MTLRRALAALWLAAAACVAVRAAHGGEAGKARAARAAAEGAEPTMHTVFSAECTPYFDWQSIALVRSHKLARLPRSV